MGVAMADLREVESSNIKAIGYDADQSRLVVQFRSGSTYAYANVTPAIHAALMSAQSKGSFLSRHIVRNEHAHPCQRLADPPPTAGA